VLDRPNMVIAIAIDQRYEAQRFLPIIARRLHLRADIGKKLDSDLHDLPPPQTLRRRVLTARRAWLNPGHELLAPPLVADPR
jgi:hypothetical protein